jgi:hypothetical protein
MFNQKAAINNSLLPGSPIVTKKRCEGRVRVEPGILIWESIQTTQIIMIYLRIKVIKELTKHNEISCFFNENGN